MYIYIYMCVAKCESLLGYYETLWPSDSPNFLDTANHFANCESLFKWIRQKTFFYGLPPF